MSKMSPEAEMPEQTQYLLPPGELLATQGMGVKRTVGQSINALIGNLLPSCFVLLMCRQKLW